MIYNEWNVKPAADDYLHCGTPQSKCWHIGSYKQFVIPNTSIDQLASCVATTQILWYYKQPLESYETSNIQKWGKFCLLKWSFVRPVTFRCCQCPHLLLYSAKLLLGWCTTGSMSNINSAHAECS